VTQFLSLLFYIPGQATVIRDDNGRSRGFGFVTFSTSKEAQSAITHLNDKVLEGNRIGITLANPNSSCDGKNWKGGLSNATPLL